VKLQSNRVLPAVISPWNFPMYLSQRSIAPALALRNAVVVKPAEDTPVTGALLLAKIFEEGGPARRLAERCDRTNRRDR
jgi:aldehyde dehydrogenase (NAD+)